MEYEMDMLKPLLSTVEERESKGQEEIKGVGSQGIKAKINCHVYQIASHVPQYCITNTM